MSRVETHPVGFLPTARPLWDDVPVGRSGTKLWHTGWYRTAWPLGVWYCILHPPWVVVGPLGAVALRFFQPNELTMMPMLKEVFYLSRLLSFVRFLGPERLYFPLLEMYIYQGFTRLKTQKELNHRSTRIAWSHGEQELSLASSPVNRLSCFHLPELLSACLA